MRPYPTARPAPPELSPEGCVCRPPNRGTACHLPPSVRTPILPGMFVVTEAEAAAIRAAFEQHGELSASVELRRFTSAVPGQSSAPRQPGYRGVPRRLPSLSRECHNQAEGWLASH